MTNPFFVPGNPPRANSTVTVAAIESRVAAALIVDARAAALATKVIIMDG